MESQLAAGDHARQHGGVVYGLVPSVPIAMVLNFISGFLLETIPGWAELFKLPLEQRAAALEDPDMRAKLAAGAASPGEQDRKSCRLERNDPGSAELAAQQAVDR